MNSNFLNNLKKHLSKKLKYDVSNSSLKKKFRQNKYNPNFHYYLFKLKGQKKRINKYNPRDTSQESVGSVILQKKSQ